MDFQGLIVLQVVPNMTVGCQLPDFRRFLKVIFVLFTLTELTFRRVIIKSSIVLTSI